MELSCEEEVVLAPGKGVSLRAELCTPGSSGHWRALGGVRQWSVVLRRVGLRCSRDVSAEVGQEQMSMAHSRPPGLGLESELCS